MGKVAKLHFPTLGAALRLPRWPRGVSVGFRPSERCLPLARELNEKVDVRAQVKALDFNRNHGPMKSGRDLLQRTFLFSDVHAVANSAHGVIVPASGRQLTSHR